MTMEFLPYGEAGDRSWRITNRQVATAGVGQRPRRRRSAPTACTFDPFLVRGMGYYTGPIFELAHPSVDYSLGGGAATTA